MSLEQRREVIRRLQAQRGSRVISYLTSTRPNMESQMAIDVIRLVYEHVRSIGKTQKIDLFLHSNGGDPTVPWRLVTLLREYCTSLAVIVPHRAFSAATMAALGADEIVMHPLGMLGPIDPTTVNPFNPRDPTNQQQPLPISVEDVAAYVALVKEDVGITHEDELVQAFNVLAGQVHPLALGNVKRTTQQGRMLAKKLLGLHMDRATDDHKMDEIVEALSSRLYYHGHPINRKEAKSDLGLKVVEPDADTEGIIWELYQHYESAMNLSEPYVQYQEFLGANPNLSNIGAVVIAGPMSATLAYVESEHLSHRNMLEYEIAGARAPDLSVSTSLLMRHQGWETENEEEGS